MPVKAAPLTQADVEAIVGQVYEQYRLQAATAAFQAVTAHAGHWMNHEELEFAWRDMLRRMTDLEKETGLFELNNNRVPIKGGDLYRPPTQNQKLQAQIAGQQALITHLHAEVVQLQSIAQDHQCALQGLEQLVEPRKGGIGWKAKARTAIDRRKRI